MSGADFISEPVISFSITPISSRWYVLVIFNADIRYNENYSSGSAHPHPTYSDPDHEHTHFSYANICFRTYDHTSFLAPVFCIRYIILIGSLFFWIRYLGAEYMLYHLGGISIMCRYFWAPWSCSPYSGSAPYMSHMFCIRLIWDLKTFVTQLSGC